MTPCNWQSGELFSEQLAFHLYEDHKKHVHDRGRSEQTQPPVTEGDNADNFQITRKFGKTAEPNLCYKTGSVIQHETGAGSSLEPAREFKLFDVHITPQNIDQIRDAFIRKFAMFSNACLNRRCNGTIFFGVGDPNIQNQQNLHLKHGQIVGISLDKSQVDVFEEWIRVYFRGKYPECYEHDDFLRAAVSMAISPLYPIRTDEGRYILEIDVEPKSSFCKEIFFKVWYPGLIANEWESGYFVREGPANFQYSRKRIEIYLNKDFRVYLDERRNLDEALLKNSSDKLVKLQELFMGQDMVINDKDKKFYLFTDIVAEDIDEAVLKWTACIDFQAVFDFDFQSCDVGLLKKTDDLNINNVYSQLSNFVKIVEDNDNEKACKEIRYGYQKNWIQCTEPNQDFKTWSLRMKAAIVKIINFFVKAKNVESKDKIIFVFAFFNEDLSSKEIKKIATIIKESVLILSGDDMYSKGIKNCIFLSEKNEILQEYQKLVIGNDSDDCIVNFDEMKAQTVEISWSQLTSFVESNKGYTDTEDLKIPSSTGVEVSVAKSTIDHYKKYGLYVVGTNHCHYLRSTETIKEELMRIADEKTQEFMKGGNPDMAIFLLAEPSKLPFNAMSALVERDITKRIVAKIEASRDSNFVTLLGLNHNPGSGATTVGKNILWIFKDKYRVGYLDCDAVVEATASILLNFSSLGDTNARSKLRKVLIFLDNSSRDKAAKIKSNLETEVKKRRDFNTSACFIILYAEQCVNLSQKDESYERDFTLQCSLNDKEISFFKSKLEAIQASGNFQPDNMISYIVMASNYDEDNEYIGRVVRNNLEKIEHTRQENLLYILSIYKQFSHGNGNLMGKVCDTYLGNSKMKVIDRLCPGVRNFLQSKDASEEGYGKYTVIEVTHRPVAKQVLKYFSQKYEKHISEVIMQFFLEPALMGVFFQDKTFDDIRSLLVDRGRGGEDEEGRERAKFSPFIECVQEEVNPYMAFQLLKKGFEVTEKGEKSEHSAAIIAQTLARYLMNQKDFESAEFWAQKAIDMEQKNFSFWDTFAQVFKRKLMNNLKIKTLTVQEKNKVIDIARLSSKYFQHAQKLIESKFCRSRKRHNSSPHGHTNEFTNRNTSYFGK